MVGVAAVTPPPQPKRQVCPVDGVNLAVPAEEPSTPGAPSLETWTALWHRGNFWLEGKPCAGLRLPFPDGLPGWIGSKATVSLSWKQVSRTQTSSSYAPEQEQWPLDPSIRWQV